MKENLVGTVETLTKEGSDAMNKDLHKRLFEGNGPFSGTNICECGGEVSYNVKRNDNAEIGVCKKCGRTYIDYKGKRLSPV